MVRGHWLDPLARQILKVTGQLPAKIKKHTNRSHKFELIEKEFRGLQRKLQETKVNYFVDVNRANANDWKKLPGCTDEMVELLIRLQRGGVQLSGPDDLFQLLELPSNLSREWSPHLIFQWYGNKPVLPPIQLIDLNSATPEMIKTTLKWPKERLDRFFKERQRLPFKNLADLQERLTLPASAIENLIGNVRFGAKRSGPILPPA